MIYAYATAHKHAEILRRQISIDVMGSFENRFRLISTAAIFLDNLENAYAALCGGAPTYIARAILIRRATLCHAARAANMRFQPQPRNQPRIADDKYRHEVRQDR